MTTIKSLPDHCLSCIFNYCSDQDLNNLCNVCLDFQRIVEYYVWFNRSVDCLMTGHRGNPLIAKRTLDKLSYKDRVTIEENWRHGWHQQSYLPERGYYLKLILEKKKIVLSKEDRIQIHKRDMKEVFAKKMRKIKSRSKHIIVAMVKKGSTLFAAHEFNVCLIYENGIIQQIELDKNNEKFVSVDFHKDTYVTATNNCTRMWHRNNSGSTFNLIKKYETGSKCVRFSPSGNLIYQTPGEKKGLLKIDATTGIDQMLNLPVRVQDLKTKDDNIVFTANMDGTFRTYDRRLDCEVGKWSDTYRRPLLCLEYDGLYGILCGMRDNAKIDLYDIRVARKRIQEYNLHASKCYYLPPAMDIACDSRYLFVLTDGNIRVLDFKVGHDDWDLSTKTNLVNEICYLRPVLHNV